MRRLLLLGGLGFAALALPAAAHVVNPTTPTVAATAGQAFSGPVVTFQGPNDPDPSHYTAAISWGDGASFPGTVAGAAGAFTVSGTHTYSSAGTFPLVVTVDHIVDQHEDVLQGTATVAPGATTTTPTTTTTTPTTTATTTSAAPPPSGPRAAISQSATTTTVGVPVTLDASHSSGAGIHFDWDLTGNGTAETSCGADPTSSVSFGTTGTHTVKLIVTDASGAISTATATIDVGGAAAPPAGAKPARGAPPTLTSCDSLAEPKPCIKSITFGIAEARNDCFREDDREVTVGTGKTAAVFTEVTFRGAGRTRLNGLDLDPSGGTVVTIDRSKHLLTTNGAFAVNLNAPLVGSVTLKKETLNWKLPLKGGTFALADFPIGSYAKLLGLSLDGDASVALTDGASTIDVWVALPYPFDFSGRLRLKADNDRGLRITEAHIEVNDTWLGPFQVQHAEFNYLEVVHGFFGNATLVFPSGGTIGLLVDIEDGSLKSLTASYKASPPGIALGSSVFFQSASISYDSGPPKEFLGGFNVTAGPGFAGSSVASLDGSVHLVLGSPWSVEVKGDMSVVGVPFASARFFYGSWGSVEFSGHVSASLPYGVASASADIGGWYQSPAAWDIEGDAEVCLWKACGGGGMGLTSVGFGACIYTTFADFGGAYRWSGDVKLYLTGCGVEWIRPPAASVMGDAGAVAQTDVSVPGGLPFTVIRVEGRDAVPNVVLRGPDGRVVTGSSDPDAYIHDRADSMIVNIRPEKCSYVFVRSPAAGVWTVAAQPGSSPISSTAVARGLPQPSVHARVTAGHGRGRILTYDLRAIPGQQVEFWEDGANTARKLATVTRANGRVAFVPADGPGGRRTIYASVFQDGAPRRRIRVAQYTAPSPLLPGRPRLETPVRKGPTLVVAWRAAVRASAYRITVRTDDRRKLVFAAVRPGRVVVPEFGAHESARVTVVAVDVAGRQGPPASVTVRRG